MKSKIWPTIIIFCSILLTACGKKEADQATLKNVQAAKTITWAIECDKRLFSLTDTKDNIEKGFDVDMAKAVTKEILGSQGKAKFVLATAQSRIPLLKNHNVDAVIATLTITPDRAKIVDFSRPYFQAGQSLLVARNSPIRGIRDLPRKTVIGIVGDNSVEMIKKLVPKAKVVTMQDYGQAVSALKSGQGDALTSDNSVLYGLAVQNPGLAVRGGTFTHEPYGIAVNKHQDAFLKAINRALAKIQRSGEYNQLIKKWFSKVPGFNYRKMYYQGK
ncbi:transporter substrate-binding domain-containing protein [Lactobacillus xylocopicola]|uniref:Glutamine ABC transporter substrate-binding protein n=1 Tax=Lactobacillus xylocopicola TaxID=2976676 RepID=A0ABN6SK60_9LACO|nr:transporter substrate-binding domain-containing protein [Lactobacillus xylocopicola]BDR60742.1 glutamine ABC transporter substrate-binding protein [Lactobacillus xylocopicola]